MRLADDAVVHVEHAKHTGDYKLKLRFSDGNVQIVDFLPFLSKCGNPLIQTYLEPKKFMTFAVIDGDLMWGDYDLVFPIADLYEGTI